MVIGNPSRSLIGWIWISVLCVSISSRNSHCSRTGHEFELSHNNLPMSFYTLTRASVHFYSLVAFVIIWLAVGTMFATKLKFECDFNEFSGGLARPFCSFYCVELLFICEIFTSLLLLLLYLAGIAACLIHNLNITYGQGDLEMIGDTEVEI
ncbi:hypothetical protein F5050DRAFT_1727545 [Lentinula boryana]|uniref:Uncharacterized protein n=1 Tax=Lentinula boryana TaxID=40481 RepID=A0ABQ8QQF1_9AGAR|nr:hypothetical protein F5050DRAFT_1727545 [Lentinula boryana]